MALEQLTYISIILTLLMSSVKEAFACPFCLKNPGYFAITVYAIYMIFIVIVNHYANFLQNFQKNCLIPFYEVLEQCLEYNFFRILKA